MERGILLAQILLFITTNVQLTHHNMDKKQPSHPPTTPSSQLQPNHLVFLCLYHKLNIPWNRNAQGISSVRNQKQLSNRKGISAEGRRRVGIGGTINGISDGNHYNPIKKMHSFIQNLCVPSEPKLKPLPHAELIDQFCLENNMLVLTHQPSTMWTLEGHPEEESQEETMEVQQDCLSAKRRHCSMADAFSKRPMFSKLQRMDRAPIKRRHF